MQQSLKEHLESSCHKEAIRMETSHVSAEECALILWKVIGHLKCMHFLAKQKIAHINYMPLVNFANLLELHTVPVNEKFPFHLRDTILYNAALCSHTVLCFHSILNSTLCFVYVYIASSPGPFPAFQCCTLKSGRVWYVKSHAACHDDRLWRGMTRVKSRSIEVNKTGPCLCYPCLLSTINARFEPLKDRLLLVWQRYNCVSCHLLAVALTRSVTFDPWDALDLLSPSLSITWLHVPGPPAFQRATLKSWEWAWGRGYVYVLNSTRPRLFLIKATVVVHEC